MAKFNLDTTVLLEFADGPLHGATVRASLDLPLGDYLAMQRTLLNVEERTTGEALDGVESVYRTFAREALRSWDIQIGGKDIDATEDGFMRLPPYAANAILAAWLSAATSVPGNSPAVSPNGASAEAANEVTGR